MPASLTLSSRAAATIATAQPIDRKNATTNAVAPAQFESVVGIFTGHGAGTAWTAERIMASVMTDSSPPGSGLLAASAPARRPLRCPTLRRPAGAAGRTSRRWESAALRQRTACCAVTRPWNATPGRWHTELSG